MENGRGKNNKSREDEPFWGGWENAFVVEFSGRKPATTGATLQARHFSLSVRADFVVEEGKGELGKPRCLLTGQFLPLQELVHWQY